MKLKLNENIDKIWGVSFGGTSHGDTLEITLRIDKHTESYVFDRLVREGRGGTTEWLDGQTARYTKTAFDVCEASPWIKTFCGRILSLNFHIIDAALDGDPYDDPVYRGRFRLILNAARAHTPLYIEYEGGKGHVTCGVYAPWRLSYSAKDDKFRLLAAACFKTRSRRAILNLSRICHVVEAADASKMANTQIERYFAESSQPSFLIRIYPERNALERAMLQFAAYRKETEYDEPSNTYLCRIYHDPTEETELLIRVLCFGPTVRVLEPPGFAAQLKERIVRQLDLNDANALKEQDICEPSSQFERGLAL